MTTTPSKEDHCHCHSNLDIYKFFIHSTCLSTKRISVNRIYVKLRLKWKLIIRTAITVYLKMIRNCNWWDLVIKTILIKEIQGEISLSSCYSRFVEKLFFESNLAFAITLPVTGGEYFVSKFNCGRVSSGGE